MFITHLRASFFTSCSECYIQIQVTKHQNIFFYYRQWTVFRFIFENYCLPYNYFTIFSNIVQAMSNLEITFTLPISNKNSIVCAFRFISNDLWISWQLQVKLKTLKKKEVNIRLKLSFKVFINDITNEECVCVFQMLHLSREIWIKEIRAGEGNNIFIS